MWGSAERDELTEMVGPSNRKRGTAKRVRRFVEKQLTKARRVEMVTSHSHELNSAWDVTDRWTNTLMWKIIVLPSSSSGLQPSSLYFSIHWVWVRVQQLTLWLIWSFSLPGVFPLIQVDVKNLKRPSEWQHLVATQYQLWLVTLTAAAQNSYWSIGLTWNFSMTFKKIIFDKYSSMAGDTSGCHRDVVWPPD